MRTLKIGLLLLLSVLLFGGCSGRELENRSFPSVLTVPREELKEACERRQRDSAVFIDYSHVKVVLLSQQAAEDEVFLRNTLEELTADMRLAWNVLVFQGDESALRLAEEKEERIGLALARYYKNQPKEDKRAGVTLKDLWTGLHGGEMAEIPEVISREKELIPKEKG